MVLIRERQKQNTKLISQKAPVLSFFECFPKISSTISLLIVRVYITCLGTGSALLLSSCNHHTPARKLHGSARVEQTILKITIIILRVYADMRICVFPYLRNQGAKCREKGGFADLRICSNKSVGVGIGQLKKKTRTSWPSDLRICMCVSFRVFSSVYSHPAHSCVTPSIEAQYHPQRWPTTTW